MGLGMTQRRGRKTRRRQAHGASSQPGCPLRSGDSSETHVTHGTSAGSCSSLDFVPRVDRGPGRAPPGPDGQSDGPAETASEAQDPAWRVERAWRGSLEGPGGLERQPGGRTQLGGARSSALDEAPAPRCHLPRRRVTALTVAPTPADAGHRTQARVDACVEQSPISASGLK